MIQEMPRLGIRQIEFPVHPNHFPRPLDLAVFSTFERNYLNPRAIITPPKIEGKIIYAWHI
jgi:hypothetical protein